MDLSLQGKVALVTGGGRGLGRSIVRGLTQAGAHVVVTAAREIEEIERAASEAPKGAVAAFLADVTFPKSGRSERQWRRSRNTAIFHGPPGTMRYKRRSTAKARSDLVLSRRSRRPEMNPQPECSEI
jgi:hypothetical protein